MPVSRKRKLIWQTCPRCHGDKRFHVPTMGTIDHPIIYRLKECPVCKGTGKTKRTA